MLLLSYQPGVKKISRCTNAFIFIFSSQGQLPKSQPLPVALELNFSDVFSLNLNFYVFFSIMALDLWILSILQFSSCLFAPLFLQPGQF